MLPRSPLGRKGGGRGPPRTTTENRHIGIGDEGRSAPEEETQRRGENDRECSFPVGLGHPKAELGMELT